MSSRSICIWCFALLLGLWACEDETETIEVDFGYEYFPLEVGKYWEYEVDSLIFDPFNIVGDVDTIQLFVREEIIDTLIDLEGNTRYILARSERSDATDSWDIKKVSTLRRTENQAVRQEDNLEFTVLTFPPKVNNSWNGTGFISPPTQVPVGDQTIDFFLGWESQIIESGAVNLDLLSFSDVLTVSIADNENFIEIREGQEQYAPGVGLISRDLRILDTQCQFCCNGDLPLCESLPWEEKAEKGLILRQRLVRHN